MARGGTERRPSLALSEPTTTKGCYYDYDYDDYYDWHIPHWRFAFVEHLPQLGHHRKSPRRQQQCAQPLLWLELKNLELVLEGIHIVLEGGGHKLKELGYSVGTEPHPLSGCSVCSSVGTESHPDHNEAPQLHQGSESKFKEKPK